MYGVQGRTWVALGDPVGPGRPARRSVRRFLERCDDFGGIPVFYEIGQAHLHRYADFGLTFVKLGEEAKVDLSTFTLEGGHASKYRQVVRRLEKDGARFASSINRSVPAIMTQLRAVSDDWLAAKASAEKGFSLGFFDEAYVSRFPVAVIERADRILAFANIWAGPQGVELSIDLMRYHRDAPTNAMEALFVHLMIWGKERATAGSRWAWRRCPASRTRRLPRSGIDSGRSSTRTARPSTASRDCAPTRRSSTRSGSRTISPTLVACVSRASWRTLRRSWPVAT